MKTISTIIIAGLFVILCAFCLPILPGAYFNYANIPLPSYLTSNFFPSQFQFQAATYFDNTPSDNQITDEGATLGRVLFYDKNLSANGTVACGSCHHQSHGFSDSLVLSNGFNGGQTRRHSMGLTNARFYFAGKFFWDERAATLEDQVLKPFQDPVEMGLTLPQLEQITRNQSYYPALFQAAFGDTAINSTRISKALAQFVRSIVSTTSRYDSARSQVSSPIVNFPAFTTQENQGKNLFFLPRALTNGVNGNCAGCHVSEAFVGPIPLLGNPTTTATTNGLDAVSTTDLGVNETTGNPNDIGKFKTPSLMNIAVRAPYMHDGRFATLEEVIEHYSSGIQNHPNLNTPLVNTSGQVGQFNFTATEKAALLAFLNTLTDHAMLTDERFSDPFDCGTILTNNQIFNKADVNIYPNPTIDVIHINVHGFSNFRINLYSMDGKLVKSGINSKHLPVMDVPTGVYMLAIIDQKSDQKLTKRIVIEN